MSRWKAATIRDVHLLRSEPKTARPSAGGPPARARAGTRDKPGRRIAVRIPAPTLLLGALMVALGWVVTRVLAHTWPFNGEDAVDRALAAHRDGALDSVTGVLSTIADTPCTIALAAVAILGARRLLHQWRPAAFIAVGLVIEVGVFLITTLLVHRARPGVVELDHSPPTSSFPSGHTAAAVVVYGAVAFLIARRTGRRQAWLLLLMPAAVAFARLYRGMHHPSDVVAGFILGACALVIAAHAVLDPLPGGRR